VPSTIRLSCSGRVAILPHHAWPARRVISSWSSGRAWTQSASTAGPARRCGNRSPRRSVQAPV